MIQDTSYKICDVSYKVQYTIYTKHVLWYKIQSYKERYIYKIQGSSNR